MSVKKSVPELRFRGFSVEWEEKKLIDEVELFHGLTYSPHDVIKNNGTLVLRSSNVKNGKIVNADNVYVNSEVVNCDYVRIGDIVIVVRNGSRSLIGKHGQIKKEMKNTVIGAFMTGFRSKKPAFINALLDTNNFHQEIEKNLGATINQITNGAFKQMSFSFAKPNEQTKIGNYFQNLDKLIEQKEKKYQKLGQLKKAMLEKMFPKEGATTPDIRFKGFSGEWEEKELGELSKITTGSSNREDSGIDGKYTFFDRSEDIRKSDIFLFDCEAIIVAGEGADFVPKYFIGKFDLHQRTYAIMNFKNGDSKFLFYYIHLFRKWFLSQSVGSTVRSLRLPMFQEMPIKFPKKNEQTKIGNYFQNLDHLIDLQNQELQKLKNIKKASLAKMFV